MKKKSDMVRAMHFMGMFFSEMHAEVLRLGGDEELIYRRMKTNSGLAREVARLIISAKRLALKYLKLIADGIVVASETFTRESFFEKNGSAKLLFSDNFKSWVLPCIPNAIHAFEGKLLKTELTRAMYDQEILGELGNPAPLTVAEFAAIARALISKQPNGESGMLLSNGNANIFYVKLGDGCVVAVYVHWHAVLRGWRFHAHDLGVGNWRAGHCVFSRS